MFILIERLFFLAVVGLGFFKQIRTRAGKFFPALVLIINFYFIVKGLIFTYLTYRLWQKSPISHFLLPPYNNYSYFFNYSSFHFFKNYYFSLIFFAFVFILMFFLNKLSKGRFFEKNEVWIAGIGIFLTQWPINLVWFFSVIACGILLHLLYILRTRKLKKVFVSLYYLWLPTAVIAIFLSKWIIMLPIIKELKV